MSPTLVIAVQFYHGYYYGELRPGIGEWPPAPGRLFQALMAAAANGRAIADSDRKALKWLETLSQPPVIAAPKADQGQRYSSFVPNNDRDVVEKGLKSLGKIRSPKTMRPHLFDLQTPLFFLWSFGNSVQEKSCAERICRIAESLYQLGRGVDMAWAWSEILDQKGVERCLSNYSGIVYHPNGKCQSSREDNVTLSCPAEGSLESLERLFERNHFSSVSHGKRTVIKKSPKGKFTNITYNAPPECLFFNLRGEGARDFFPFSLEKATALVVKARDCAAKRLCEQLPALADDVERYLIGRGATDADKAMRVQIMPLPSIGHHHADMMIRRLVVRVPQSCPLRTDDLAWAFAQVFWSNTDGVIERELQPADDDAMAKHYRRTSRCWHSVTPLALNTIRQRRIDSAHIRKEARGGIARMRKESDAVRAVYQSLRHAGIHAVPSEVRVQREPFDGHGERSEAFADGTRFPKELLWHVSVTFATPVTGPLLLGNGRYLGLGVMRPIEKVLAAISIRGQRSTRKLVRIER